MAIEHLCLGCMSYLENPNAPCPNCGWFKTMRNAASQLQTGYTLTNENQTEKYIIGRVLGQGGFGISYLAWNANRGEKVVVKEYFPTQFVTRDRENNVIPIDAKGIDQIQHGLDNFLKEAYQMLEFGNDPNVVNVKNFFQANNTAYIVMEFIDGQTLKEIIENSGGRLPLDDVLEKLAPIFDVLERMHKPKTNANGQILRQPLIHRDISPDNIMFTRNGIVKLLDFGAARNFEDKKTGIIRAGYSPPEQFMSDNPNFMQGSWTDVYALAATIYHAVTGQLPVDSISRMGSDSLVLPSSFGVKLEPFQEKALLKGLETDYRKRYQTVREFINSLRSGVSSPVTNEKGFVLSIVLSAIGELIATLILILFMKKIFSDLEFDVGSMFISLIGMFPTIILGALIWDLLQIYKGQRPDFLYDALRQDIAFWTHVFCASILVIFAFIFTKSWDSSKDVLGNMFFLFYAVVSVAGIWLGRKFLRKVI